MKKHKISFDMVEVLNEIITKMKELIIIQKNAKQSIIEDKIFSKKSEIVERKYYSY